MDVLILGWSDIVRRRVVPALLSLDGVDQIHVASSSGAPRPGDLGPRAGRSYDGDMAIEQALDDQPGALVYVSGVNVEHALRVLAAFDTGHDVVVDKPAVMSAAERRLCLNAAQKAGRLLAEAIVWPTHPQVTGLLDRLRAQSLVVRDIDATFTIPPLPVTNFRTDQMRGGGAAADMGAYAMSPARIFGRGRLDDLRGEVTARQPDGLDVGFEMSAHYSDGVRVRGSFSLVVEYVNRLALSGEGWSAVLEPAFSSRPDTALTVALTVDGRDESFTVPPADSFANFLAGVIGRIAAGDRTTDTERTAVSSADLLALRSAVGVRWGIVYADDED